MGYSVMIQYVWTDQIRLNGVPLPSLARHREVFCLDDGPKIQSYHLHMSYRELGIQRKSGVS